MRTGAGYRVAANRPSSRTLAAVSQLARPLRRNFERDTELANAVVRRLDLPMPKSISTASARYPGPRAGP